MVSATRIVRIGERMTGRVSAVELADAPQDGGKWAIYCEHEEGTSILQDTNKRRLASWRSEPLVWCCYCQEERNA